MSQRRRVAIQHRVGVRRGSWAGIGLASVLLAPGAAQAGGFEIPDQGSRAVGRGGAYAVGAADLTALHYNPGKLASLGGTRALYTHNLVWHDTRFQRATLSDAWGPDAGTTFDEARSAQNFYGLGAFGVVASDFGLDNWMFAAGAYGPSAVGRLDYPNYGPQSFLMTEMDVILIYYSLAAAWQIPEKFGVGVTLQWVDLPSMRYALVTDSAAIPTLNPIPDAESSQLITDLEMQDRVGFTAIVGLWGRPHPRLEIGAGGRVIPVNMTPRGGVATDKESLVSDDVEVEMRFTLPVQLRGGLRYIHPMRNADPEAEGPAKERFDVELDLFWENWSALDAYRMFFEGTINGQPIQDTTIQKKWRDVFSIRLGGDVNFLDGHLTLRAGGYYETGAVHPDFAHLDFPSFNRGGVSGGVTGSFRGVSLTVGYMHVFQQKVETDELYAQGFQVRPLAPCPDRCGGLSGVPANAGVFTSNFDILGLSVDFHFNEMFPKMGERRRAKKRAAQEEAVEAPIAEEPEAEPAPEPEAQPEPEPEAEPEPVVQPPPAPIVPQPIEGVTEGEPEAGRGATADPEAEPAPADPNPDTVDDADPGADPEAGPRFGAVALLR